MGRTSLRAEQKKNSTVQIKSIIFIHVKFDIMKQIKISCYNNSNIEILTSEIIITITVKTITIIKLPREIK